MKNKSKFTQSIGLLAAITVVQTASGQLPFTPLSTSAAVNPTNVGEDQPFLLPGGFTQKVLVDQLKTFTSGYTPGSVGGGSRWGNWDMMTLNETGPEAGRYAFIPHEIDGQGVSRYDFLTNTMVNLVPNNTINNDRLDPSRWTPWGTVIAADESQFGTVFEITNPLAAPGVATSIQRLAFGRVAFEGISRGANGTWYYGDEATAAFFKFVPTPANVGTVNELVSGQIFALKITTPVNNLTSGNPTGTATWIAVNDVNGAPIPGIFDPTVDARQSAIDVAATNFVRPEDSVIKTLANGHEAFIVAVTGTHSVVTLDLDPSGNSVTVFDFANRGTIDVATGLASGTTFTSADNVALGPDGRVYIVEDQSPGDIWATVDNNNDGIADSMARMASLKTNGAEPTGLIWDNFRNQWLVNVQHPSSGNGALIALNPAAGRFVGPSTASTPYAVPVKPSIETTSLATVDNATANGVSIADDVFPKIGGGTYNMVGIPDGLGAFDNNDGTFTVLMNHEIQASAGIVRAHGSIGSFVSQWVINKNTLAVVGAKDLITSVVTWNTGTSSYNVAGPAAIGRLCSADLPEISAFSNGALGTAARIFMSGEETGAEGRAFGHVVTGPSAGISYELPRLGKFSWENALAAPFQQNTTVVIGTDDSTPGEVYVYLGTKTNAGTEVDKAGLTNGLLYGIKVGVAAAQAEDVPANAARINNPFGIVKGGSTSFSLVAAPNGGNVANVTGAQLQAAHTADGVTRFLRPEDGAWDTVSNNKFYFATTDRYDGVKDGTSAQIGRSRLWVLEFSDITNPLLGGSIKLLIDGSETLANGGLNMIDNIGIDSDGKVTLVEDVGNQAHSGKFARFDPTTGLVEILAKHDAARNGDIGIPQTAPFSQDEEFSGNIDITDIMAGSIINTGSPNERWYLMDDQQHYSVGGGEKVEGGQLIMVHDIAPINNVTVTRGGFVRDRKSGKFAQKVTLKNNGAGTLEGPFELILDGLSTNAALANQTSRTAAHPPLSSPYITVTGSPLAAGASASVTLEFTNPTNAAISYTARVLNSVVTP